MTKTAPIPAAGASSVPGQQPAAARGWMTVLGLSVLASLMVAVYWPALSGGYLFDDYPNIVLNKALRVTNLQALAWLRAAFSSESGDLQRPLAMLTFAIQYYFTGLDPMPMKAFNLGVHVLNALLVYALGRRLLQDPRDAGPPRAHWLALFLAFVWASLPINFFPATYIVQRMESMAQVFVLAGLWAYCVGRQRQLQGHPGWMPILVAFLVMTPLGMLCKESAALLPLYCLCLEIFRFRFATAAGGIDRRLAIFYVPTLFLPALVGAAWTLSRSLKPWAYSTRNFTLVERLLTEPRVLFDYVRWTFVPDVGRMSMYHDDYVVSHGLLSPPITLLAIMAIPALLAVGWRLRERSPLTGLGIWWFFAGQALTAAYIPLELVFEHRNYFPSLGLALILTVLVQAGCSRAATRKISIALAISAILAYASLSHLRALEWSSPLRFAFAEAAKQPDSARTTYQLGQALVIASKADPKSPLTAAAFDALERARSVPEGNILPSQGLLLFSAQLGRPGKQEWWDELIHRLDTRPIGAQERAAIIALGNCAISKRCPFPQEKMVAMYVTALSRNYHPAILSAYANYVLNVAGDPRLAVGLLREASRIAPREPQYRANLALALMMDGQFDRAQRQIDQLAKMPALGRGPVLAADLQTTLERELSRRRHAQDETQSAAKPDDDR